MLGVDFATDWTQDSLTQRTRHDKALHMLQPAEAPRPQAYQDAIVQVQNVATYRKKSGKLTTLLKQPADHDHGI